MAKRPVSDEALSKERVLAALKKLGGAGAKKDLARILGIGPEDKKALRKILRELEEGGALGRSGKRAFRSADALPNTSVMQIVDRDADGELLARCAGKDGLFGPPVRLAPGDARGTKGEPAVGVGDRVLARIAQTEDGPEARVIKRLGQSAHRILGVFRKVKDKSGRDFAGGRVEPADRKARHDIAIVAGEEAEAKDRDLVLVELIAGGRPNGPKRGRVVEVVGSEDDPRAASILAIHTHGVPMGFSEEEERQAKDAKAPTLKGRTDLRDMPLITIDPGDARDHDDAVFAAPDDDDKNKGGFRVWVAIADVAAYVTPGSALDRGAFKRGNSTYFPDRVAPMLPETLSADLCSLREGEERACMAVEMVFDKSGKKLGHKFTRGLMRSAAKLSYEQAQAAIDGKGEAKANALLDNVLKPLWAAYECVKQARDVRGPLELETTEHSIQFEGGKVVGVTARERFDAHKLIEEFMIQANVCAAETLEKKQQALVYRVHDRPSEEKIAALSDFLPTVNMKWSKGERVTPSRFNRILEMAKGTTNADIVNEVVLRSQAQAVYSPDNLGHFGLNLDRYAHFTSPIRRYADLIVHRALVRALKLGDDGLSADEEARLEAIAEHISQTERRSMAAERDAASRYIAAFLADRVGADFEGRVTGVTRFGLFIRLNETQADGLAPISSLGHERWHHDEAAHALVGEQSGARFPLGMRVLVRLEDAAPVSGGLILQVLSEPEPAAPGWRKSHRAHHRGGPRDGHRDGPKGRGQHRGKKRR